MAVYEYLCEDCHEVTEKFSDSIIGAKEDPHNGTPCKKCGKPIKRIPSMFRWHFGGELIRGTKMEFSESTIEDSIARMQNG